MAAKRTGVASSCWKRRRYESAEKPACSVSLIAWGRRQKAMASGEVNRCMAASASRVERIDRLSERTEAWDSPLYWTVGVPLTCASALVAGAIAPRLATLLGVFAVIAHVGNAIVRHGIGNMFPLGLALMLVLAVVATLSARLGARLRGRPAPA